MLPELLTPAQATAWRTQAATRARVARETATRDALQATLDRLYFWGAVWVAAFVAVLLLGLALHKYPVLPAPAPAPTIPVPHGLGPATAWYYE